MSVHNTAAARVTADAANAMRHVSSRAGLLVLLCVLCVMSGCARLPANTDRVPSYAFTDTANTKIGQAVARRATEHPDKNGVHALASGRDAFAMRMALIANAQRSLDLQYYIWTPDTVGQLMFEQIWRAAERGVRVRLLLDDQVTSGMDAILSALDAHPNIEVRLFNPYANRRFRLGEMGYDFARINRRMHNKSFIADNEVAIVGGRNIANEYYSADPNTDFTDLDVAVVGPVVQQVSNQFDLYWNFESSYPASKIIGNSDAESQAHVHKAWDKVWSSPEARRYINEVNNTPLLRQLLERRLPLEWTDVRIIYDRPEKVLQNPNLIDTHLLPHLQASMGQPLHETDVVSAYFIPGTDGTQGMAELIRHGVRVRVLTNSLAATDVAVVHTGYKKYRVQLLQAGVQLYELKPNAATEEIKEEHKKAKAEHIPDASSRAALHSKTFSVDRQRIFIGSFNFDPRSEKLNTEMGAVIDSPTLAQHLAEEFDKDIPLTAYTVRLTADGKHVEWIEHTKAGDRVYTSEPESSWLRILWVDLLSFLPIEGLL